MVFLLFACSPDFESRAFPEVDSVLDSVDTAGDGLDSGWRSDSGRSDDSAAGGDTATAGSGEPDCPEGVVCVDWLPYGETFTTRGGTSEWDSYGCAPGTDESGPEVLYRVTVAEEGFLALDLRQVESGADVDVHLLGSLDPEDCFDRGHWTAGAWVPAGEYYVVADSWVDSAGASKPGEYTLQMGHLSALDMAAEGMDRSTAALALQALDRAWDENWSDEPTLGVLDFALRSDLERLWIWDLAAEELLHHLHASHGEGSSSSGDAGQAVRFSNTEGSHQSSLGMAVGAEDYEGSNGLSLRLDGLEAGYNDAVRDRAIVVHGADYARSEYVDTYGRLGQSWGCPAVDDRISDAVVEDLQDAYLWSYYPDGDWSVNSTYLP